MGDELTDQQKMFCREYIASRDLNGTQAAIRAGYAEKSAGVRASRLLAKDKVQRYVKKLMKDRLERLDRQADAVIHHLWHLAEQSLKMYPLTKRYKSGEEWVDVPILDDRGEQMYAFVDPKAATKALELIGKHHAMFTEKHQFTDAEELIAAVKGKIQEEAERYLDEALALQAPEEKKGDG